MQIKIVSDDITQIECDALVVDIYEDSEELEGAADVIDSILDCAISSLKTSGEIKGKPNEITVIHTLGRMKPRRVAVCGMGKKDKLDTDEVRAAIAGVCRSLRSSGAKKIATAAIGTVAALSKSDIAQALAEGAIMGLYEFRRHITREREYPEIEELIIAAAEDNDITDIQKGIDTGVIMAEAACLARDMANEPSNNMTPSDMAAAALKVAAGTGIEVTVYDRDWMEQMGMGGLLGVARGSKQPPKFIVMQYKGGGDRNVGLVGKGITFDSGGISIKPSEKMEEMKGDMSGGAAVIAAMSAIARMKPKIDVTGIVPATENMPGGSAQKPGDVFTAMNGKTVEVINTDAEGRLILADALSYAHKQGLSPVIDIATLTGACMVALGTVCSGVFTNNPDVLDTVLKAAEKTGEKMWQLPTYDEYKEQIKSDVADIKNTGGRYGGAITAALFLAEFIEDTPWVHIDIAGTMISDKNKGYLVKGATGIPVRTLVTAVLSLA